METVLVPLAIVTRTGHPRCPRLMNHTYPCGSECARLLRAPLLGSQVAELRQFWETCCFVEATSENLPTARALMAQVSHAGCLLRHPCMLVLSSAGDGHWSIQNIDERACHSLLKQAGS